MIEQIQTEEPPRKYTPNNVVYWEESSRELRSDPKKKATVTKANKFLQNDCIHRVAGDEWNCKPLKDYNKTTHKIKESMSGDLSCSCQGFSKKAYDFFHNDSGIKPFCSHTIAVKQFCFLEGKE